MGTIEWLENELTIVKEPLLSIQVPPQQSTESTGAGTSEMQGAYTQLTEAHVQLQEYLEAENKKKHSREKCIFHMWKGMKTLLKALGPERKILGLKASDAQ